MSRPVAVILGGGRGARLFPLTLYRSKPAVPIGGKYRLIDVPVSNCLHAGVNQVYVLTQFNSASLNRHIANTYRFDPFSNGFVEILAAEQTPENPDWYQGTADAVRQQLRRLASRRAEECLLLSGDHLYRMNYRAFIEGHRRHRADITLAVKPVTRELAHRFGILRMNQESRIVAYREKPSSPRDLDEMESRVPLSSNQEESFLANMGVYVFRMSTLVEVLSGNTKEDFGRHIIPDAIHQQRVFGYVFDGYWEDIGTIRSFYDANVAMTGEDPPFQFHDPEAPIFTHPRYLAGAKLDECRVTSAVIGDGSVLSHAAIERSVVGIRSLIGSGVRLSHAVVMGADYYQGSAEIAADKAQGIPPIGIGRDTIIRRAIVDKNARIGQGVVIANEAGITEADGESYYIREGIVVVPKDAVIQDGRII